jgi:hypothetical protein
MNELILEPNIARPDDVFQILVGLYGGCDEAECRRRSARLILLLAHHVGDLDVLADAVRIAAEPGAAIG